MEIFIDMLTGDIDENKQYYTEEMFSNNLGHFALTVLLHKKIITIEELDELKKEYMKQMNKKMIKEIKNEFNPSGKP